MEIQRKTILAMAIACTTATVSGLAQAEGDGWMLEGGIYYSDIDDG